MKMNSKRAILLLVIALLSLVIFSKPWEGTGPALPKIQINETQIMVDIADSVEEQQQGLSGRPDLQKHHGMLFVYAQPEKSCYWMKDMQFSIDILWFDERKTLVHQEKNISPDTYPNSYCTPAAAMYVLELLAGESQNIGVTQGQTFEFVNQ